MRIIGGTFRSRQLKSSSKMALRPTSDRLRETLFNVIATRVPDSRFLDLFAGSGAVGIEAISRGSREAVFVESHAAAAQLIRANLGLLGIVREARILPVDARKALEKLAAEKGSTFDLIFLDPPYAAAEDYERVLEYLGGSPLVEGDSLVIVEHRRNFDLSPAYGTLARVRILRQGDASLSFYRCSPGGLPAGRDS